MAQPDSRPNGDTPSNEVNDEDFIIELTEQTLTVDATVARLADPGCGAFVTFIGTVRNEHHGRAVERLDYTAYAPMAELEMRKIAHELASRWPIRQLAILHRLGRLEIGEASIVIVLALPHRKESFEALQFAIDRFKETVPIWKKEHFTDGDVQWVEGS